MAVSVTSGVPVAVPDALPTGVVALPDALVVLPVELPLVPLLFETETSSPSFETRVRDAAVLFVVS